MDNMSMQKKKPMHMVTFLLMVIGGLNWLVFALFNWDVSQLVGGMDSSVAKVIYILVGLATIVELAMHKKMCKMCGMEKSSGPTGMNMNKGAGM